MLLYMMENSLRDKKPLDARKLRSAFHADMLRYFANLMLSAKMRKVSEEIVRYYNDNKSIIVTVQHTGESSFKKDAAPSSVLE